MKSRKTEILLVMVAVLLALNLVAVAVDWLGGAPEARADMVPGKNWFTTSSPDGRTVYLWHYWTSSSVGPNSSGEVKYYGQIVAEGGFRPAN